MITDPVRIRYNPPRLPMATCKPQQIIDTTGAPIRPCDDDDPEIVAAAAARVMAELGRRRRPQSVAQIATHVNVSHKITIRAVGLLMRSGHLDEIHPQPPRRLSLTYKIRRV